MGFNWSFYCCRALDELYTQELTTVDVGARQQLFRQVHEFYLTKLPFITLYSPSDLSIVHDGTHYYLPSTIAGDTVNIWEWWSDNGKC